MASDTADPRSDAASPRGDAAGPRGDAEHPRNDAGPRGDAAGPRSDAPLLELQDVKKYYPVRGGLLGTRTVGEVRAVDGVSFRVGAAETLSIVGESGCGKTTTARLVLRLESPTAGTVVFQGTPLDRLDAAGVKAYRASVQAVFQDPWSSLEPAPARRGDHRRAAGGQRLLRRRRCASAWRELLVQVGLRPDKPQLYPHQFSGGQRQRVAIARALSIDPG